MDRMVLKKKRIRKQNIPDGYLIDLSSVKEPKLFLSENELAAHDPLKHIAVQILNFSLSFETSPLKLKRIDPIQLVPKGKVKVPKAHATHLMND